MTMRQQARVLKSKKERASTIAEAEKSDDVGFPEPRRGSVDFVMTGILRDLNDGGFIPGQRLIEGDLTKRFEVGRGSVREALKRLEAEGLVVSSLHKGSSIRAFGRDSAQTVIEAAQYLQGVTALLAAERAARPTQANALRKIVAAMKAHVEENNPYEVFRMRYRFVEELMSLSKNEVLGQFALRFDMSVVRAQFRSVFDLPSLELDIAMYGQVADCVAARDLQGAQEAIHRIFRRIASDVQKLPDHFFIGG